jgi:hypothetical protein
VKDFLEDIVVDHCSRPGVGKSLQSVHAKLIGDTLWMICVHFIRRRNIGT